MKIYSSNDVLTMWEQVYVPDRDVFCISKKLLKEKDMITLTQL